MLRRCKFQADSCLTRDPRRAQVAGYIKDVCGDAVEGPNDIGDVSGDIAGYDGLIVGAPTWNTNADSERSGTEWDEFLYGDLTGLDLSGKKARWRRELRLRCEETRLVAF